VERGFLRIKREFGIIRPKTIVYTNIINFSLSSQSNLSFQISPCEIVIRDFGKGFHPEHVRPGHGLGNMHDTAREMGADFRLDSSPGEGTTISLLVPIT